MEVRAKSKDLAQPFLVEIVFCVPTHVFCQQLGSMAVKHKEAWGQKPEIKTKKQLVPRPKKGDVKAFMTLSLLGNPIVVVHPRRPGVTMAPAQVREIGRKVVEQ